MRLLAGVALIAMTLLVGAWTLSSESYWNPKGRAVVKTPDGVSHVLRGSACDNIPHPGRLRFGGVPIDSAPSYMSLVVREREGNPSLLDIIDGILRVAPNATVGVLGTARIQDVVGRRGTFVLHRHDGGGVLGKARFTGTWNCGLVRPP